MKQIDISAKTFNEKYGYPDLKEELISLVRVRTYKHETSFLIVPKGYDPYRLRTSDKSIYIPVELLKHK